MQNRGDRIVDDGGPDRRGPIHARRPGPVGPDLWPRDRRRLERGDAARAVRRRPRRDGADRARGPAWTDGPGRLPPAPPRRARRRGRLSGHIPRPGPPRSGHPRRQPRRALAPRRRPPRRRPRPGQHGAAACPRADGSGRDAGSRPLPLRPTPRTASSDRCSTTSWHGCPRRCGRPWCSAISKG